MRGPAMVVSLVYRKGKKEQEKRGKEKKKRKSVFIKQQAPGPKGGNAEPRN